MQVTTLDAVLWTTMWATLGWLAGHRLSLWRDRVKEQETLVRERENRKRKFRALMAEWHSEFVRTPHTDPEKVWGCYLKKVSVFNGAAKEVAADFEPIEEFERLRKKIGELQQQEVTGQTKDSRNIIVEELDKLIAFTESR